MSGRTITVPAPVKRVGLFADVHGTFNNVLDMQDQCPDIEHWYCAGDITDMFTEVYYNEPSLRIMARLEIPSVMGNHDYRIREQQSGKMGEEARGYLQDLPFSLTIQFGGKRIRIYHATPSSRDAATLEQPGEDTLRSTFNLEEADVFVVGHTHSPYVKAVDGTVVINPGALGVDGVPPTFCVLDAEGRAEIKKLGGAE